MIVTAEVFVKIEAADTSAFEVSASCELADWSEVSGGSNWQSRGLWSRQIALGR